MSPTGSGRTGGPFLFLVGSFICLHGCMAVTRVTASLWALRNGWGEWVVGVLLSLFALAPMGLSLWAGRLADRHGLHRPLRVAVWMGVLGCCAPLFSLSLPALVWACLLSGGALGVAAVAIQKEVGAMATDADAMKRAFSWMALGPALSNALAPVCAGLLMDHLDERWAMGLAAVLPLLAGFLARSWPSPPARTGAAQSQPPGRAWALLQHAPLRRLLLLNIVLSASWDAHSFVVPVVGHAQGLSASSIGLVLGAFAAAATGVRLALARWAEHLDEARSLRVAIALAAAVLAVYAWLPGTAGLMLGSALLGVALGSVQPMVLTLLHQVTPEHQHGQALGLRMLATNGATLVMPLAFGALASVTVAAAPLWLMAASLLWARWVARRL
jgi:MFS family permease